MYTPDEILKKITSHLENIKYDRHPQSLYAPISYSLSMGGKRIRPTLVLLAYNMWKDDVDAALPVATVIETYHNYTLLHDDLMDNADVRRSHPTVHRKWNANTAILSGDAMLVMAYKMLEQCPAPQLGDVLRLFSETALEICEGQQYDMDFETRLDVSEDEYIEMIRLKTSVLLACALKTGAILAGAPQADADALYRFGECIGLAFQLQDDYLDVYGDPRVFGKAIGGDILCNKKTYMLINAMNLATGTTKQELGQWLTATQYDPQEKISAVTAIYNKLGINTIAEQKIEHYFQESKKHLDALSIPEEKKQMLRDYTAAMMKRKK